MARPRSRRAGYAAVVLAALNGSTEAATVLLDFETQPVDAQTPLSITTGGLNARFNGPAAIAACAKAGGSPNLTGQYDDLRQLVNEVPQSRARLAFVQFAADPFAGDLPGPKALIERLRPRLGGLLLLDQPEGLTGHFTEAPRRSHSAMAHACCASSRMRPPHQPPEAGSEAGLAPQHRHALSAHRGADAVRAAACRKVQQARPTHLHALDRVHLQRIAATARQQQGNERSVRAARGRILWNAL